jgi:hypothetical protein
VKAERESVSYITGTGKALAGMATVHRPSSSPSRALLFARNRAEGNTTYEPSHEKAAPPQAPTKERGNDRTTEWG